MKQILKKSANSVLSLFGLSFVSTRTLDRHNRNLLLEKKFVNLIGVAEDMFREKIDNSLPPDPKRHELMLDLVISEAEAFYLLSYLHRSLKTPGDICEFGVAHGTTSRLLAHEIKNTQRTLWLFDSFEGLPAPTKKDIMIDDLAGFGNINDYEGTMSYPESKVRSRLAGIQFPNSQLKIVPGFIEKTAKTATLPEKVCFAFVDFDFYEPISVALDLLSERLSVGGFIIVDDYGRFSQGAQTATDEFIEVKKGQFSLIKPESFTGGFVILSKNF